MSRRSFYAFLATLLAAFALGSAVAAGQGGAAPAPTLAGPAPAAAVPPPPEPPPPEPPVQPGEVTRGSLLLARGDGAFVAAPLLATEVHLAVRGIVARATVRQRFANPTDEVVEAVYAFPLPDRAAVDGLEMRVGDRVVAGEIAEREAARAAFAAARSEGRRAALVEQRRPDVFTCALTNLGPGETVEVVLRYQEDLRYDSGTFRLRFPLVVAPRYAPGGEGGGRVAPPEALARARRPSREELAVRRLALTAALVPRAVPAVATAAAGGGLPEPYPQALAGAPGDAAVANPVRLTVELDPGFPLARLASRSHLLRTGRRDRDRWHAEVVGEVPADRDFLLEWEPAAARGPRSSLLLEPAEGGGYHALLMVLPPAGGPPPPEQRLPRETIYVLDTSGSMAGESIARAREALLYALRRLAPEDTFNVVAFASRARRLFPHSAPADLESLEEAARWVERLDADGGTEMLPALALALAGEPARGRLRQVVFLTDGAVANERQVLDFVAASVGEARLFTVAIGAAPSTWLLRKAAELGRGTFTHVATPGEVAERMEELYRKLESPVARDLELAWDDLAADAWPRRLPDLYAGEPLVVAAWLPRGGGVTVRAVLGDSRHETRVEPRPGPAGSGLDKLWARRQVEALVDGLHEGADAGEVRRQVVELGLRHGLVTRWTSLVAAERFASAPAGAVPRRVAVPVLLPAGGPGAGLAGLPQTATPARLLALAGGLLAAAAIALWRWR